MTLLRMTPPRWVARTTLVSSVLGALTASDMPAQAPAVPVRPLGPIVATAPDSIGRVAGIRALSDGRVLINDPDRRRLVLYDSTLRHPTVVADTTSATSKAYGGGFAGLMPFTGDSSLVVDRVTGTFVVLAPNGAVGRLVRMTNRNGANNPLFGDFVSSDRAGHVLYRGPPPVYLSLLPQDYVGDTLMVGPDSFPILRQDLATQRVDTLVMIKAARARQSVSRPATGGGRGRPAFNPLPAGDDWIVLNDGTVAVLRVSDYHVDWVGPDKHLKRGPPIPTQWIPLTREQKAALIDSLRASAQRSADVQQAFPVVEPSDLPDVLPPFIAGATRADEDGNLWVRTTTPNGARSPIYDVINREGRLVDRVQMPPGWNLIGLGRGVAYITHSVGRAVQLAEARIR